MLTVALVAVVTAALAQPSLFWMRVMFTVTVAVLAFAVVGALAARGKARTFWIGTALFGGGYFLLLIEAPNIQFSPAGQSLHRALLSQMLLDTLAKARGLTVRSHFDGFRLWDEAIYHDGSLGTGGMGGGGMGGMPSSGGMPAVPPGGGGFFDVDPDGLQDSTVAGGSTPPPGSSGYGENSDGGESGSGGSMGPPPGMSTSPGGPGPGMGTPYPGSGMMPGSGAPPVPAGAFTYGSYNHFLLTGHCAFVILIGLIGGMVSRWAFGREDSSA
jgi:hypothetical protein